MGTLQWPAVCRHRSQRQRYRPHSPYQQRDRLGLGQPGWLGDNGNNQTGGLAGFNGYLYASTLNHDTGGQIWRSDNGSTWTQVVGDGFGDINNYKIEALYTFGGSLYAGVDNTATGVEVWSSSNDSSWHRLILMVLA